MTLRIREIFRGTGALALLLVIVVGPPIALVATVGWPLPSELPTWSEITGALGGSTVSDTVLLNALACGCWVVWAAVVVSILQESVAWIAGRGAEPLPGARAFQPFARRLVMAATLLFAASRATGPTVGLPVAVPAVATAAASPASPSGVEGLTHAPVDLPSCVVQPRDSLWKLAEQHLGDGMRWREIWELNRELPQVDGRSFTDPDLIHPGWLLTMPVDATGLAPPDVAAPPPSPTPTAPPAELPPTSVPPPTTATPPKAEQHAPPTTLAEPTPDSEDGAPSVDDPDHDVVPVLAAAALVAAGAVASLDRLRRRQARHGSVRRPPLALRQTEVSLRRAADSRAYTRLDLALRTLAAQLRLAGRSDPPRIDVVSVGPAGVEILLDGPTDAPAGPFDVTTDGRAWTLPTSVPDDEMVDAATAAAGPSPALVVVGTVDDRSVSVDLESAPCTVLNGDADDADDLLQSMVLDLATSERADDIEIVLVGHPPSNVELLERVRCLPDVQAAASELEPLVERTRRDFVRMGSSSAYGARVRGMADGAPPTVVVVRDAETNTLRPLLDLARHQAGLALLVTGDVEDVDRELCVEGDTVVVKPLGLVLRPAAMPANAVEDAAALIADSAVVDLTQDDAIEASVALPSGPFEVTHDADGRPIVPEGHVVVRVQGGVEVFGGARPIDRRRCTELVVYLALHPEGVDEEQIRGALWPESNPTRSAFNETISRARRCLGLDPSGDHHVRHCERGRYRLGPYVHLETNRPSVSGDQLALPFRGSKGYEWAYTEGIAYTLGTSADATAKTG